MGNLVDDVLSVPDIFAGQAVKKLRFLHSPDQQNSGVVLENSNKALKACAEAGAQR